MGYSEEIKKLAEKAIADKVFPGCVIGIVKTNGERVVLPFGNFTYEEDSLEVQVDTIYDLASITKSIPTSSIALQLIDRGELRLEDQLIKYIPEFNNSDREDVKIKHLLTYTLDGYGLATVLNESGGKSLMESSAEDLKKILLSHDFDKRPGEVFKYSNIPAAILGLVIEKVTGKTLDILAEELFFNSLNMKRTTYYPEKFSKNEIPPTEINSWRGLVHGEVHDESAFVCKRDGVITGHAGLFSTAPDLLNFMEMLLNKGKFKGKKYFSEEIIDQVQKNQIPELSDFTGLGWELNQPRYMGKYCSPKTFGKTGFTGTLCVCDIEKSVAYVILSNRIYPHRPEDSSLINSFRKEIGEIILRQ